MDHRIHVAVILLFLAFSTAIYFHETQGLPQNGLITFPATRIIPNIDGMLESDEWADANVIDISSGNLAGYLSIKCDSQFLYLLIESVNDTTHPVTYPRENTWVAIDSLDDDGTTPQTDDYLFNSEFSWANIIWRGNGSGWTANPPPPDYYAVQVFSNSSHSNSIHLVNEVRIPLSLLGNSSHCGFYVSVCDSNMHRNIEWPADAGCTWDWWPPSTGNFPPPNLWGTIEFPTEPVAVINYTPGNPIVNESITFNGGSSYDVFGNITTYSWDFGDGTNASGAIAAHTYSSNGTYSVTLNVTDIDDLSDSTVEDITVYSFRPNNPPIASFTWFPAVPEVGETVTFDGSSSYDPDGWIIDHSWNLGDGAKLNGSTVSHAYCIDGSYDVSLSVTDNNGVSTTSIQHFTVLTGWSGDLRLTENPSHDHSPSIMQASDGTVWVVWYSDRTVDNELCYKVSSDGGLTWSNDTRLTNSPGSEDMKPSIMQASDGTVWVVWSSNRLGTYNVYYKTSDDNGGSWSGDIRLTTEIDEDPSVMQASDGTVWVVWSSNRGSNIDLYYKVSSDGGLTWSNDTRLTDHVDSDVAPSVMQTDDGTMWIVWSSNRDGPLNVYYKTSDDNGSSWSNDTPLVQDAGRDNTPSTLQTSNSTLWVVWSSNRWDLEEDMLFNKMSSDRGATWTNDTRVTFVTGPNRIDREPSVMQASDGTIWLAWASDRIPSGIGQWGQFEIYYKTKPPSSPPPPPETDLVAPLLITIPTVDGYWNETEWDDAPQYSITGSGGTGFIRFKYDNSCLYIIIDSVWDTIHDPISGSYEGTYVAFDTFHDGGTAPQPDDYLFFCGYSTWMIAWKGNGTQWVPLLESGFVGEQVLGTSPNSGTTHRIDEMKVPLVYVGSVESTSGFYVIIRDDGSDPDGYDPLPPTNWVEWPGEAGGIPNGWPGTPYVDPCPAPTAWGALKFMETTPPLTRIHIVNVGEEEFEIATLSNSSITALQLNTTTKTLSFNVTGAEGTIGFCEVLIPANLLWGSFSIYKDGSPLLRDIDYTEAYNGTHYTFYITYTHTTHTLEIQGTGVIAEFPAGIVLMLLMFLSLVTVAQPKKTRCKTMPKTT